MSETIRTAQVTYKGVHFEPQIEHADGTFTLTVTISTRASRDQHTTGPVVLEGVTSWTEAAPAAAGKLIALAKGMCG